ncbi:hypothetical protein V3C99_003068, partial [Haemonchus contortus]|uniref:Uncharacterized protein n=1 Tax=Haemonchus contortus TaxID=6289 RepID=A0A7I4Y991_HAECO
MTNQGQLVRLHDQVIGRRISLETICKYKTCKHHRRLYQIRTLQDNQKLNERNMAKRMERIRITRLRIYQQKCRMWSWNDSNIASKLYLMISCCSHTVLSGIVAILFLILCSFYEIKIIL